MGGRETKDVTARVSVMAGVAGVAGVQVPATATHYFGQPSSAIPHLQPYTSAIFSISALSRICSVCGDGCELLHLGLVYVEVCTSVLCVEKKRF
jgi:hypothetical protein